MWQFTLMKFAYNNGGRAALKNTVLPGVENVLKEVPFMWSMIKAYSGFAERGVSQHSIDILDVVFEYKEE